MLLPLDIAGNIKEKICETKAPVRAGLVVQADGHKSLYQHPGHGVAVVALLPGGAALAVAMVASGEEKLGPLRRGETQRKTQSTLGFPAGVAGRIGMCRWSVVALQGCPLLVVPHVLNVVARIPARLWHIHVGKLPYNPSHSAATKPARFNQQVMPDTRCQIPDETNAIGINGEKS